MKEKHPVDSLAPKDMHTVIGKSTTGIIDKSLQNINQIFLCANEKSTSPISNKGTIRLLTLSVILQLYTTI